MKNRIIYLLLLILILAAAYERGGFKQTGGNGEYAETEYVESLQYAFENQISNLQIRGEGNVEKVLKDDTKGVAHQRIILRVAPDQTVLIAHNIDLAPRVENINKGDRLEFYGEYEWNNKGGVVHWTHRDPGNKHVDGWLIHDGKRYE